jgi:hypothetical protein
LRRLSNDVQPSGIGEQSQLVERFVQRKQMFLTIDFNADQKGALAWG